MSITCRNCGNLLAPNTRICPTCGAQVNYTDQTVRMQQPQQQRQQYVPQPFPQKKGNNTMLLVIITFLLIIAIIFLAVFLFKNSDKKKSATTVKTEQTSTSTAQKDVPKDRLAQLQEVVDQRHLTTSEVDELSANDKRLLRNYIYARHGYIFKDSQLSNYFGQFSWYSGRYTSQDQVERMFNTYERNNVQKLSDNTVTYQSSSSVDYYEFIGHCNIRAYPTESSAVIATREDGEICYISSREGDWYYITLANGTQGWTHRQNLRAGR